MCREKNKKPNLPPPPTTISNRQNTFTLNFKLKTAIYLTRP